MAGVTPPTERLPTERSPTEESPADSGRAYQRSAAVLLYVAVLLTYVLVADAEFLWDDDDFVWKNPLILASDGLARFWASTEPPDYFPLTSSMLWIEWRLFGMWAGGYALVNAVLHATSAVLLWRVLERLKVPGAYVAALAFGLHPVCVESVAWITERKNVLPMALYLLALLYWLAHDAGGKRSHYFAALGAFLAALLAKTSVVMLPFVLLGIAWWRRGKITVQDLLRAAPFFGLSLILGLVTMWYQANSAIQDAVIREDGFASRLVTAGAAVWFYLGKALLPVDLCFVYPRWNLDPSSALHWLPLAALIVTFAVLVVKRGSWGRAPLAALGYFTLTLLPVLGFVDIFFMKYSLVADHWQYVALPAVIALVVGVGARVLPTGARRPVAIVLLALLAVTSFTRTRIFHDQETLWRDTLARNPGAWIAHNNLGMVYEQRGEFAAATQQFDAALELQPQNVKFLFNAAHARHAQHDLDGARPLYERVLAADPEHADAHRFLASLLIEQDDLEGARTHFAAYVELRPDDVDAQAYLAGVLARLGHLDEARARCLEVLEIDPDHAAARDNLRLIDQAIEQRDAE